jgi:hypothetical protein
MNKQKIGRSLGCEVHDPAAKIHTFGTINALYGDQGPSEGLTLNSSVRSENHGPSYSPIVQPITLIDTSHGYLRTKGSLIL